MDLALHCLRSMCTADELCYLQTSSPPRVREGDSVVHAAVSARKPHVVEVLLQYGAFTEMPVIPHSQKQDFKDSAFLLGMNTAEVCSIDKEGSGL